MRTSIRIEEKVPAMLVTPHSKSTSDATNGPIVRGISSTAEIIAEAANGRMFILVDDEDRENEGDLVLPAQMVTPTAINFMATYGRGLICLSLDQARADALGLAPMTPHNGTRHQTAFTVSIEAREGVTTGISAADRARTIATAIESANGPDSIVTPGHVFPLIARSGGVLARRGHTEASIDVARLAGLRAAGVICEIMRPDGTMARLPDLIEFARHHGLKIGTIRDLVAYRRQHDRDIVAVRRETIVSRHGGVWRLRRYRALSSGMQWNALIKGSIEEGAGAVQVHLCRSDLRHEAFGTSDVLARSMRAVAMAGRGVVIAQDPMPFDVADDGDNEAYLQILHDLGVADGFVAHVASAETDGLASGISEAV